MCVLCVSVCVFVCVCVCACVIHQNHRLGISMPSIGSNMKCLKSSGLTVHRMRPSEGLKDFQCTHTHLGGNEELLDGMEF